MIKFLARIVKDVIDEINIKPRLSFTIRIVQLENGDEVITGSWPNFGKYGEKIIHELENTAAKILKHDHTIAILFQQGAILEVNAGFIQDTPSIRVGIQVININSNKKIKNFIWDRGLIKIEKLRTYDLPCCLFEVRLVDISNKNK